jgi:hypothetical protein
MPRQAPPTPACPDAATRRVGELLLRLVAASVGAYALCWSLFAALCVWLPWSRASIWYFTGQIAPLPLLGTLLWAFIAPTAQRALAWPLALTLILSIATLIGNGARINAT